MFCVTLKYCINLGKPSETSSQETRRIVYANSCISQNSGIWRGPLGPNPGKTEVMSSLSYHLKRETPRAGHLVHHYSWVTHFYWDPILSIYIYLLHEDIMHMFACIYVAYIPCQVPTHPQKEKFVSFQYLTHRTPYISECTYTSYTTIIIYNLHIPTKSDSYWRRFPS